MNEYVSAILAQETTKTSKIQQLLNLGLTHTQIADLVTRGNRGFVWNVHKKMLDNGTYMPAPMTSSAIPVALDYSFTRRWGVEIEAYNCTREKLIRELRDAGIKVYFEGYTHRATNYWKLVTDSSLSGSNTFELVSPILEGEAGLSELEKVCWVLELCSVKVNDSCGLHIHMDAADFTMETWKNLALTYKHIEPMIDKFMPNSRRNNTYCRSLNTVSDDKIKSARTIDELREVYHNQRYHKVNFEAYSRHKTVEFRQHSGTTNFTKIENWVRFIQRLIIFASAGNIPAGISLENLPFLEEKQKLFYKLRTKKLSI